MATRSSSSRRRRRCRSSLRLPRPSSCRRRRRRRRSLAGILVVIPVVGSTLHADENVINVAASNATDCSGYSASRLRYARSLDKSSAQSAASSTATVKRNSMNRLLVKGAPIYHRFRAGVRYRMVDDRFSHGRRGEI